MEYKYVTGIICSNKTPCDEMDTMYVMTDCKKKELLVSYKNTNKA